MFICDECLKKLYENAESYIKSLGLCEICKKYASCNNIYHERLIKRKNKRI
jgi:hypothetical protein